MKLKILFICILLLTNSAYSADDRPNILFFFADDWGRYASVYANSDTPSMNDVIATPNIDRIGNEGVIFRNAFVPVASCGPCRASLATGRYFWNCGSRAFLNPKASNWADYQNPFDSLPKFVDLLRESGYFAQKSRKTFAFTASKATKEYREFGKVNYERYGLYVSESANDDERRKRHGEVVKDSRREMRRILKGTPKDKPFFFVFGSINAHRPYTADSGKKLWGIEPDSLEGLIPPFLPDTHDVRRDFSDYLGEVLALDLMLGAMLDELEAANELDNTVIILSGDHGIPGIPRGKTNCYDLATRVPLLVRWPEKIHAGREVDDFVSVMDIGPTLLELAGVKVPESMDGKSFYPQLTTIESGWIDPDRDRVIIGRELHYPFARDGNLPYPMRAVRTRDYLYIRNFKPDRWPMGAPYNIEDTQYHDDYRNLENAPWRDIDASLTKSWLLRNRESAEAMKVIQLTIDKRPSEELYNLRKDPHQLNNLAQSVTAKSKLEELRRIVDEVMQSTGDPRLEDAHDRLPWVDPAKL